MITLNKSVYGQHLITKEITDIYLKRSAVCILTLASRGSAVGVLLSVCILPLVCSLRSAVCGLQSAVYSLAVCGLQSTMCCLAVCVLHNPLKYFDNSVYFCSIALLSILSKVLRIAKWQFPL